MAAKEVLGRIVERVSANVGLVASGPDALEYQRFVARNQTVFFSNGALEHQREHPARSSIWFVTRPLIDFASRPASQEVEERKRSISGCNVDLVIVSGSFSRETVSTALARLRVAAEEVVILSRPALRDLLFRVRPLHWLPQAFFARESHHRADLKAMANFIVGKYARPLEARIPMYWKPSSGGQAAALIDALAPIKTVSVSGISFGTDSYLRAGHLTTAASRGGHHPTDCLFLSALMGKTQQTWWTTYEETARRTGMKFRLENEGDNTISEREADIN